MSKSQPKILFVEDDWDTGRAMQTLLGLHSIDVTLARDSIEALAQASSENFDLFLLDSRIPGTDGFEVCRQLRAIYPKTPSIFYTCLTRVGERHKALEAGATEFVIKPHYEKLIESFTRFGLI
jgi:DNA-binding response OmpR family regulator